MIASRELPRVSLRNCFDELLDWISRRAFYVPHFRGYSNLNPVCHELLVICLSRLFSRVQSGKYDKYITRFCFESLERSNRSPIKSRDPKDRSERDGRNNRNAHRRTGIQNSLKDVAPRDRGEEGGGRGRGEIRFHAARPGSTAGGERCRLARRGAGTPMLPNPSIKFILGAQPHITASHMLVTRRHGVKSAREISVDRVRGGGADFSIMRAPRAQWNPNGTSAAPSTLRDHDRGAGGGRGTGDKLR